MPAAPNLTTFEAISRRQYVPQEFNGIDFLHAIDSMDIAYDSGPVDQKAQVILHEILLKRSESGSGMPVIPNP